MRWRPTICGGCRPHCGLPTPYEGLPASEIRVIRDLKRLWTEHPVLAARPRPGGHPAILAERLLDDLDR